jgi:hypothetical protein
MGSASGWTDKCIRECYLGSGRWQKRATINVSEEPAGKPVSCTGEGHPSGGGR